MELDIIKLLMPVIGAFVFGAALGTFVTYLLFGGKPSSVDAEKLIEDSKRRERELLEMHKEVQEHAKFVERVKNTIFAHQELSETFHHLKENHDEMSRQFTDLTSVCNGLRAENEALRNRNRELQAEVERLYEANSNLAESVSEYASTQMTKPEYGKLVHPIFKEVKP